MEFSRRLKVIKKMEKAYTLLELLVVLSIIGLMMSIAIYGLIKFRQTIIVANTTKELMLQLRKARRYAINNVITKSGYTPSAYYIELGGNDIKWGECNSTGQCSSESVKSAESSGVSVSSCSGYSVIKFNHVTGDFIFAPNATQNPAGQPDKCTIDINIGTAINTKRQIEVSRVNRTIKIL